MKLFKSVVLGSVLAVAGILSANYLEDAALAGDREQWYKPALAENIEQWYQGSIHGKKLIFPFLGYR